MKTYNSTSEFSNENRSAALLYGRGDYLDLQELESVPTPEPMGRFHKPIPYFDFASGVVDEITNAGITISRQEYQITGNERINSARFFGAMEMKLPGDWDIIIGLRGAHDQSIRRGICLGTKVIVCSNLCFSGELGEWKTKQTLNAVSRVAAFTHEAIQLLPQRIEREAQIIDNMRNQRCSNDTALQLITNLHMQDDLSASQMSRALHEWYEPSYIEHATEAADEFTTWRLFNACTQAIKPVGERNNNFAIENKSMAIHREITKLAA